jgi:hypothetical protein
VYLRCTLTGGRVSSIVFLQCLPWEWLGGRNIMSQNKVLPTLSSLQWCTKHRWRAREDVCPADLLRPGQFSWSLYGVRSGSCDLQFSSLAIVATLVRWSFEALARRIPVGLLQQSSTTTSLAQLREGGARMVVRLRLVSVLLVFARWSRNLFVILITFGPLCTVVVDFFFETFMTWESPTTLYYSKPAVQIITRKVNKKN